MSSYRSPNREATLPGGWLSDVLMRAVLNASMALVPWVVLGAAVTEV